MKLHKNKIINRFMLSGYSEEESIKLFDAVNKYCIRTGLNAWEIAWRLDAATKGDIGSATAEQITETLASCEIKKTV